MNQNRIYRNRINDFSFKISITNKKFELVKEKYYSYYDKTRKFEEQSGVYFKSRLKMNKEKTAFMLTEQEFKIYGHILITFNKHAEIKKTTDLKYGSMLKTLQDLWSSKHYFGKLLVKPLPPAKQLDTELKKGWENLIILNEELDEIEAKLLMLSDYFNKAQRGYNSLLN